MKRRFDPTDAGSARDLTRGNLRLLLNVVNTSGEYLFGRYVVENAIAAHGALRTIALSLWKIASDVRLMAMGPRVATRTGVTVLEYEAYDPLATPICPASSCRTTSPGPSTCPGPMARAAW